MDDIIYYYGTYASGGGTAIESYSQSEGPWASLTVNLYDYGILPTDSNTIFIPIYKLMPEYYQDFLDEFAEKTEKFTFGPYACECLKVKLKNGWQNSHKMFSY